jgi:hypothetical protein
MHNGVMQAVQAQGPDDLPLFFGPANTALGPGYFQFCH